MISTKAGSCGSVPNNTMLRADTSHSRMTYLSCFMEASYLQNFRLEEESKSKGFIDYQNPYMFLETRNDASRELYNDHKALYPSVENLQPGITESIQANKKLKNLRFRMWLKEMEGKTKLRKEETE